MYITQTNKESTTNGGGVSLDSEDFLDYSSQNPLPNPFSIETAVFCLRNYCVSILLIPPTPAMVVSNH